MIQKLATEQDRFLREHVTHWDGLADKGRRLAGYYHRELQRIYRFLVSPGQRVLEIGCAQGDLLAAVQPGEGVGVDISPRMIERARARHPNCRFIEADAHALPLTDPFDVIILSDLVNDVRDVQGVFQEVRRLSTPSTRIVINFFSRLWQLPLELARKLRLARPTLPQNWLTFDDTANLLNLSNLEVVRHWEETVWPLWTPLLDRFCNRFLVKLWPFRLAALTHFVVVRPQPTPWDRLQEPTVSVIVPARNEAGNIGAIFDRVPNMGRETELVFVEGHSRDDTFDTIAHEIERHPQRRCQLWRQTGAGKGDAVRLGFAKARGDVLMILDADLTMPPEELPRYYDALVSGKGEFINGVRLVYPMEDRARRFLNLLANKFFSLAFSWLLGQPIKDTLCGTKVLWRSSYETIAAHRHYFGDFDPFGDFDLIFGAAKQNLKLIDLPIRYRERTYGTTNIQRWRHGWMLLQMVGFAANKIKFF
jgi:SAM-dependent methyltransferase